MRRGFKTDLLSWHPQFVVTVHPAEMSVAFAAIPAPVGAGLDPAIQNGLQTTRPEMPKLVAASTKALFTSATLANCK
jgi:hypothetical protein